MVKKREKSAGREEREEKEPWERGKSVGRKEREKEQELKGERN